MKPTRVLVVDDEPLIREALDRRLKKAGYAVATAGDGKEALEHLQEHPVDVVLTDVRMPNMDGLELIAHLWNEYPAVRVMVMSAYDDAHLTIAAKLGESNFFAKPLNLNELMDAVGRVASEVQGTAFL